MNRTGHEIFHRFTSLAHDVFGISIEEYLNSKNNRYLYGYMIDVISKKYRPLFGDPPDILTDSISTRFIDSITGYKVDVASVFPATMVNADLLLLSTDLLPASDKELDSILLHEICHLAIDGKMQSSIQSLIDSKAKYHGERLYKKTDRENETATSHTLEFCIVLAGAAERHAQISSLFEDRLDVINFAMRYDLRSNART